jgi:hypothetical protein
VQVRLVDFNPIGGTTSPLLFDWDELSYSLAGTAASHGTQLSAAAAILRRDEEPDPVHVPEPGFAAHINGNGHACGVACPLGGADKLAGADTGEESSASVHQHRDVSSAASSEIMFRFNTHGARVAPSTAVYGAPYDMVDCSDGSALSALLQKLTASQTE